MDEIRVVVVVNIGAAGHTKRCAGPQAIQNAQQGSAHGGRADRSNAPASGSFDVGVVYRRPAMQ